jgi:predicted permease
LRSFPVSETAIGWGIPVIIIGAIVLSFFLYRFILKLIMKKIDLEKYFDPIFGRRKK